MRALLALFFRSVRDDCRARLPIILRMAMAGIILTILAVNVSDFDGRPSSGRTLLMIVTMVNAGFLGIAAVAIFPSAITEEKEDETLPLLRMTNLSPLSILVGKAVPRLLAALLLLAVQIPFTLLAVTLGGVSADQVWSSFIILGSQTYFLCGLAVLASVLCRTTIRAGFLTGLLAVLFYVVLPFIAILVYFNRMRPGFLSASGWLETVGLWIVESNPIYALATLLEVRVETAHWPVLMTGMVGGTVFVLLAWLLFDRFCSHVGEEVGRQKPAASGKSRRRWFRVARPGRFPLIWKDYYFLAGGLRGMVIRCALAVGLMVLVSSLITMAEPNRSERYYHRTLSEVGVAMAIGLLGLELVMLSTRIFGVERQKLTLAALVGLPWSTGRIIWQKVVGCLFATLPWFLMGLAAMAFNAEDWLKAIREILFDFRWSSDSDELAVLAYIALQALLLLLVIVWFSLKIRRGSFIAGALAIGFWNMLFALWVDSAGYRSERDLLFFGVFITVPVIFLVGRGIYRRIPAIAAQD